MRLFYADPGLRNNVGHHANVDRALIGELRRRGIALRVLGFGDVEPGLQAELEAEPFFRAPLYFTNDGNPVSGWLNAFETGAHMLATDLSRLNDAVAPDDLLYMPFALPAQLKAMGMWMASHPPERLPHIVMGFVFAPGLDPQANASWSVRDSRVDPSGVLASHAAIHVPKDRAHRLHLVFPDPQGAALYGALLGLPVAAIAQNQEATTSARNRAGTRPITVAMLGDQRGPDKGYHLIPGIATGLLQSHPDIRFVIHNANPENWPAAQEAVRAAARSDTRIELHEGAHDPAGWTALLDRVDLLLCPYSPALYHLLPSGLHSEALANAIPAVAPANTAMARLQEAFGGGTTFAEMTVPSVTDAGRRALDDFDNQARAAHAGAQKWQASQGPARVIDDLMAFWRS